MTKLNKMLESRKFCLFLLVFFVSTLLLSSGLLTGDQWIEFNKISFGAYAAGNVGEHFSQNKKV